MLNDADFFTRAASLKRRAKIARRSAREAYVITADDHGRQILLYVPDPTRPRTGLMGRKIAAVATLAVLALAGCASGPEPTPRACLDQVQRDAEYVIADLTEAHEAGLDASAAVAELTDDIVAAVERCAG